MRNKIIFSCLIAALFVISGVAGYAGPEWLRTYHAEKARADFIPAGVPQRVVEDFSGQFNTIKRATEPMRLPDAAFRDKDGKEVRIADFKGRPTLVNMWATWCAPCVVELPSLNKFAQIYGERIQVIGISVDQSKTPKDIADFLEKRQLGRLPAYLDETGEFGKNLGLRGIPTSFLIGSDGLILYRFEGEAIWTSPESRAFFDIFLLQKR